MLTSVNDFYSFGNNKEVEGLFGTGYLDAAKAVNMNQSGAPESVKDFELTAAQDYFVITWTIPDAPDKNVSSHIVYYSTEPFDAGSDISKLPKKVVDTKFFYSGDVCSEEIGGLANLTTYYVAIQAVNRWGNAAPLSPVKTIKTNAGPKITIAESSLDLAATATAPITSGVLTIGNEAEGITNAPYPPSWLPPAQCPEAPANTKGRWQGQTPHVRPQPWQQNMKPTTIPKKYPIPGNYGQ